MAKKTSHKIKETIYEPEEDSYLLAQCVKKLSKGNVLDMGAGSGIQGFTALKSKNVTHVLFADINPAAIKHIKNIVDKDKEDYDSSKISLIVTDLFSNIGKDEYTKFDTIIFNPPYLPDDEFDDEKLITTGGKKGWEIYDKFLRQSKLYLTLNGQILLLFSSLTDKNKIDELVTKHGYGKNMIAKKGLFMEQLYVYLLKSNNENIHRGHRGIVEIKTMKIPGKNSKEIKVAIKSPFTESYSVSEEAKFLKILNEKGIGPKLYNYDEKNNRIIMEFINGDRINDFISKSDYKKIISVLKKILDQLYVMDKLGINKLELTNPYKHIIVRKKSSSYEPVMIDFERCIYTLKPKNITQFIQYLCSGNFLHIMDEKKITIDKQTLFEIAKAYKETFDKKYLKEIISCVYQRKSNYHN
ncbi:MAG TPA: HemK2/MTQ2 family protein methyltransferase [Alphaproteobacteria bacterium]|nr:HemK2/MTQ2 family protein methyltransferase [Alphaproteobacteria bacterium]